MKVRASEYALSEKEGYCGGSCEIKLSWRAKFAMYFVKRAIASLKIKFDYGMGSAFQLDHLA